MKPSFKKLTVLTAAAVVSASFAGKTVPAAEQSLVYVSPVSAEDTDSTAAAETEDTDETEEILIYISPASEDTDSMTEEEISELYGTPVVEEDTAVTLSAEAEDVSYAGSGLGEELAAAAAENAVKKDAENESEESDDSDQEEAGEAEEAAEETSAESEEAAQLAALGLSADARMTVTEEELNLLAAIIYCEAGGEETTGQIAVGAVVLNRVESASFQNTIAEVIYAAGQFTPAMTGLLDQVLADGSYAACLDSARAALNGENPVGDCLYFNSGSGSGIQIGNQHFY